MSKPTTTLERRLDAPARGCRVTTAVRQHGAAAYGLGGLHGLALWLQARARLSRLSPVELQELRALARVLLLHSAPIRRSLEQQLQAAAEQQQVPASFNWEQRQQLLVQREAQRRAGAGDRQPVPLVPAVAAALRGRGRHKGAQPIGECGARLARKIDRLLAEVQAAGAPEQGSAEQPEPGGRRPQQPEAEIPVHGPIRAMGSEGRTGDQPEAVADHHQPLAQAPAAEPAPAPRAAWPISPSLLPATPAGAVVAPAPRKRAPRGTCCPRELELPLTLLLQQIHHHEDELDWPEDPEFPWELAIETLEELQASGAAIGEILADSLTAEAAPSTPGALEPAAAELAAAAEPEGQGLQIGDHREPGPEAATPAAAGVLADALVCTAGPAPEAPSAAAALQPLAESATADLHEQVLVAAAQADLEPLPVSIRSAAAVPETQAIAAALEEAWLVEHPAPATAAAVAELSPKARAIAELGAALLLQGGQSITLPAATAAELLEALV